MQREKPKTGPSRKKCKLNFTSTIFINLIIAYNQCRIKFFSLYEKKKKQLERLREQLKKLDVSITDKEENKEIALGTSKLNYLDPRISVAW